MLTQFIPTAVMGIYQHAERKTYHVRNLRSGEIGYTPYRTLDAAALEQHFQETREQLEVGAVATISLDTCISAMSAEVDAWEQLTHHPLLQKGGPVMTSP